MNTQPFTIERTLNAPVERVWTAITDKDQMREWYFDISAFKAEPGTYSWRYEGYEGNSFVTFELFPEGNKTRIRLTHEGLESFPKHPDFAKTNFAEGWTHIIGTSLPAFVERELVK
jgi:uncharacterized protein YndB with AHSA1/START domain